MPYQTIAELMDDWVLHVSAAIIEDSFNPTRLPMNYHSYWRWTSLAVARMHVLFPDIQARLDDEFIGDPADRERIYAYQLKRWYGVDFSDAENRVESRVLAKQKKQAALIREFAYSD